MNIVDNIENQLINNIVSAHDNLANAKVAVVEAELDFKNALHISFKYGIKPDRLLKILDEIIDYDASQEILKEYKPKNRREWRMSQHHKAKVSQTPQEYDSTVDTSEKLQQQIKDVIGEETK